MQRIHQTTVSLAMLLACAVMAFTSFTSARAADVKAADVAGTWNWTMPGRNGGPDRKMSLVLKADGDKITGELESPGRDGATTKTKIEDAALKGEEISFKVVREFNGNKMTSNYSGKVAGDVIKGKNEFERNGEKTSREWEAKREAAKK